MFIPAPQQKRGALDGANDLGDPLSLVLPPELGVCLESPGEPDVRLNGLLVALDLLVGGQYYYGTHVGLTDDEGRASLTAEELQLNFQEDQRQFPMDYKVPLSECDAMVRVRVEGGASFSSRQAAALSPLTAPAARQRWAKARNAEFRSTSTTITLASSQSPVELRLAIERLPS
jgi:hypothetical protein